MTSGGTRQVRLIDMAGGRGVGGLLLYIDAAGRVMGAVAPGEAGLHGLVAGALEVYTLSDSSVAEGLVAAVQAAAGQAAWVCEAGEGRGASGGDESALTLREWEVLQLVVRGLTNQAIAGALGISERTARDHLMHIYARLGVLGRGQAIAWAVRRALARH